MSAVVAIVGRPNVGKSSIFNRLVGKRRAIESDVAGTTRDRLYQTVKIQDYPLLLVDTGGLELDASGDIEENVQTQSQVAIDGADVILFVVDVRTELTSEDFHAADMLRKSKKRVILLANKCDNSRFTDLVYNMYELGFGEPVATTALHTSGFDELESRLVHELKEEGFEPRGEELEEEMEGSIKIAFLGRPNVGKSTMVNSLFGKERVVTSEVAGTTRDSSYIPFDYDGTPFTLIDTAGIRRRGKIESGIEKYSILRSMSAVSEADICVLLLDYSDGVTNQDMHVSQFILEEKKGLVIMVNKMDLVDEDMDYDVARDHYIRHLKHKMAYVPWAPVVFSSALKRKNIFSVLDLAKRISLERQKEIDQDQLSMWLDKTVHKHAPAGRRGKRKFDVLGVHQKGTNPPRFVFQCDWPEYMHFSYSRYLENEMRQQFGFTGTSITFVFRRPYDRGARKNT